MAPPRHPHLRDGTESVRTVVMRTTLLLIAMLLASCATAPVRTPKVPDLPEAEPDPLAFLGISFPTGVAVTASVITIGPVGSSYQVLACTERENVVGFVPPRDVDYVNLYLVRQLPAADPRSAKPYLVVELWRYRPAAAAKICHQWVIWQDDPRMPPSRADYSVLIEDLGNRVLSHRSVDIAPHVLERLVDFHAEAVEFFRTHPPEDLDDAAPVAHPPTGPAAESAVALAAPRGIAVHP